MTQSNSVFVSDHKLDDASRYILKRTDNIPAIAIVLGSGLGHFASALKKETVLNSSDVPNFPKPTVEGHAGKIIIGRSRQQRLIAIQGRSHYYEGKSLSEVTFYVQLLANLGVTTLILTNAAGGINPHLNPGNLVILKDYINFTQLSVLPQKQLPLQPFTPALIAIAKEMKTPPEIVLSEGVYCWTTGPSYETPAEVRALRRLGGDVVGMSTIPEVLVAAALGLNVLGLSLVTNYAAGISQKPLTHQEVQAVADRIKRPYALFIAELIAKLDPYETN